MGREQGTARDSAFWKGRSPSSSTAQSVIYATEPERHSSISQPLYERGAGREHLESSERAETNDDSGWLCRVVCHAVHSCGRDVLTGRSCFILVAIACVM